MKSPETTAFVQELNRKLCVATRMDARFFCLNFIFIPAFIPVLWIVTMVHYVQSLSAALTN